jgi:hypothetical protein
VRRWQRLLRYGDRDLGRLAQHACPPGIPITSTRSRGRRAVHSEQKGRFGGPSDLGCRSVLEEVPTFSVVKGARAGRRALSASVPPWVEWEA